MRFPHNTKIFRGQLDAAPFVGVFFLLVIFLLFNSGLVFTPGIPIRLPEAAGLPATDNPTAVVAVDADGNFYFENQLCNEARLKARLGAVVDQSRDPVTLVVQADKNAKMEVVVRLGMLARSLGIREMLQAVRPPVVPVPVARALER
jgi:biopolymer transport protein ExbD